MNATVIEFGSIPPEPEEPGPIADDAKVVASIAQLWTHLHCPRAWEAQPKVVCVAVWYMLLAETRPQVPSLRRELNSSQTVPNEG